MAKEKTEPEMMVRSWPNHRNTKETVVNGSKTCYKHIDIGHMNVDCLAPNYVNQTLLNVSFDIFCAVETFTHAHFDFSIHSSGYIVFHSPAKKKSF